MSSLSASFASSPIETSRAAAIPFTGRLNGLGSGRGSDERTGAFAQHRLSEITIAEVDRYRQEKVREGTISAASINKTITRLAQILEVAVERELIDRNPARGKRRRLKERRPERTWLDRAEQIVALLDAGGELDAGAGRSSRDAAPCAAGYPDACGVADQRGARLVLARCRSARRAAPGRGLEDGRRGSPGRSAPGAARGAFGPQGPDAIRRRRRLRVPDRERRAAGPQQRPPPRRCQIGRACEREPDGRWAQPAAGGHHAALAAPHLHLPCFSSLAPRFPT